MGKLFFSVEKLCYYYFPILNFTIIFESIEKYKHFKLTYNTFSEYNVEISMHKCHTLINK